MQRIAGVDRRQTTDDGWQQSTSYIVHRTSYIVRPSRPWLQDLWLWILMVGPVTAPLFVALGLPVLRPFADGIYLLGQVVCPKIGVHLVFLGEPLAVCSSCWAAVFGLWTIRLLYGRAGEGLGPFSALGLAPFWSRWQRSPVSTRLSVLALGFMPWAIDVMLWDLRLWYSPHAFMMIAGFLGGLVAGALMLPAASEMRARLQTTRILTAETQRNI